MNSNIKVGTIAPIAPIIRPQKGVFENRIHQFENLKAIKHMDESESESLAIDFWITLTKAQKEVFNHNALTIHQNSTEPFLKSSLTADRFIPVLKALLQEIAKNHSLTQAIIDANNKLQNSADNELMDYAHKFMALDLEPIPAEYKPFVGAALQLFFYQQAIDLVFPDDMQGKTYKHHCPCCGMPPIASVIDPADNGLRYLECSLCETKWHYVRSKCHECNDNGKLELITIDDSNFPIKAECCPDCKTYIKHLDRTKNPLLDLFVEDLASLDLDFALNKEGYHRTSANFYLG